MITDGNGNESAQKSLCALLGESAPWHCKECNEDSTMATKPRVEISDEAMELMMRIRKHHLSSGEFNGLHVGGSLVDLSRGTSAELLKARLIEVMTGAEYINIHIRPWAPQRSIATRYGIQNRLPNRRRRCSAVT